MKLFQFFIISLLALEANAQLDITYEYGTYLGRAGEEYTRGIECYENGKCFIFGSTSSTNFYNGNAFQTNYGGGAVDGFYSLFTDEGELEYSSFFGGSSNESIFSISQKNGYYALAGFTTSPDFPITSGAYQEELNGDQDIFVALFSDSHELIWCTYFGGQENEGVSKVVLDEELNIYVSGGSGSSDLGTPGVHQEIPNNPEFGTPFLVKFSFTGSLEWCTYFEGNNLTSTSDLSISNSGEQVYLGGRTFADEGIALNGHQTDFGGGDTDCFITAFDSENGTLNWSTYFGGDGSEFFTNLETTQDGIALSGETTSSNNMASDNAYQEQLQGSSDGFVAHFNSAGSLQWSTYFGGEERDAFGALSSVNSTLIALGGGSSQDGIAIGNPFEPINESSGEYGVNFMTSFDLNSGIPYWSTYLFSGCQNLSLIDIDLNQNGKIAIAGRASTNGICANWVTDDAFQAVHIGSADDTALLYFTNNVLNTAEKTSQPLLLWPNPVGDQIQFSLPGNSPGKLQIINTNGAICTESDIDSGIQKFRLQDLVPGLYIIRISTEKGTYSSKFLKL